MTSAPKQIQQTIETYKPKASVFSLIRGKQKPRDSFIRSVNFCKYETVNQSVTKINRSHRIRLGGVHFVEMVDAMPVQKIRSSPFNGM